MPVLSFRLLAAVRYCHAFSLDAMPLAVVPGAAPGGGFEALFRAQAYLTEVAVDDAVVSGGTERLGGFVDRIGHVMTWRPVVLRKAQEHPAAWGKMVCNTSLGGRRCEFHGQGSLQAAYDLEEPSAKVMRGREALILDLPQTVPGEAEAEVLAQMAGPAAAVHLELGRRALRLRVGRHVYRRCGELCAPTRSVHKNTVDLAWALAPLWGPAPAEISIVDIGCQQFGSQDPLASLLGAVPVLRGLCLDTDEASLARARERLEGHAVEVLREFLTPARLESLLLERMGGAPVDVLKVDIDSFDVDVLEVALATVRISVVVAEFRYGIPPPFLYARHYSEETTFVGEELEDKAVGVSLSYLVERLSRHGFWLYKMNEVDTVWIRKDLAWHFSEDDKELSFPVDEWACYLQTPFYVADARAKFPLDYTREWLLDPDTFRALRHIWGNTSALAQGAPFTLDVVKPRLSPKL